MKHHLTYKDDKSDKFWNIEVSGKSFTVTYGKTGTAGQTQTKTFDSEEECQKEAKKLLSEKLKKGYAEGKILAKTKSASAGKKNQEPQADYLKEWENIVNAKDLHKALNEHFAYLADSPGYEKVLEAVMKEAICASIDGSYLIIDFPSDILCASHPPADLQQYENWPIRFRNLVSKHESLELDEAELFLGGRGEAGLYTNAHRLVDKDDSFVEKINWDKTPNDPSNKPVDDYYDPYADVLSIWYEDDPKHLEEDLAANEPREPSVGALFLARMSEILELYITPSSTKNDTEIKTNISFKPILKISRCVRQGLIYRNDLITLEPQVEKNTGNTIRNRSIGSQSTISKNRVNRY
ncbi:WGR domain protein [Leptospira weilii str. Ecochallenge]|uniref:WGR domain protein n=1 Tax=Leptospira weilii str. Ecochallenge TaxID=1049986 RepID=N1UG38_9LEPT|nr:WGR domain protein [Leptospira weilii str. Ecochallenge]